VTSNIEEFSVHSVCTIGITGEETAPFPGGIFNKIPTGIFNKIGHFDPIFGRKVLLYG